MTFFKISYSESAYAITTYSLWKPVPDLGCCGPRAKSLAGPKSFSFPGRLT